MAPGDPRRGPLGRFAAAVVGLKGDAADGDSPAALFRKLRDDDYLPDPLSHEALLALAGRPVGPASLLAEEAMAAEEARLLAEVERLAADFFAIPATSRAERWQSLARACARHHRPLERLKALRPGLSIDREALADQSPAARRLLDDLLELFAMPNGPRAVESRGRVLRFRSDPAFSDADRARALKQVPRRYPAVAALSRGYLEQLAPPGRRSSANRGLDGFARKPRGTAEKSRWPYVGLALFLLSLASRLLTNAPSTSTPPPSPPAFIGTIYNAPPNRPSRNSPPVIKVLNLQLRYEIKGMIRRELTGVGKSLDVPTLDRVVAGLPFEELPQAGGMESIVLVDAWTDEVRGRFVARLRAGLEATDLGLDEEGLDDLAAKCLPSSAQIHDSRRRNAP